MLQKELENPLGSLANREQRIPTSIIHAVKTRRDLKRFIKFPWKIYRDYPNWVPPLIVDRLKLLDEKKNPFFKHAEMQLFLAERDGELVGRIGAIIDHNYIEFHQEKVGFFGFFESVDDFSVAKALLDAAQSWLGEHGMPKMIGPMNPSTNNEVAVLIDGFQHRPSILMTYNPPYYAALLERCGLKKAKDLYCYHLEKDKVLSEKLVRIAEAVRKRENLTVRPANMKKFDDEIELVKEVYNRTWTHNWGFVPWTDEEFEYIARDLKQILIPDLLLIAEVNSKAIGFSVSLPDIGRALQKVRHGRLLPFGILKLLWYSRKANSVRVVILGVVPEYQKRGVDGVLYYETWKRGTDLGFQEGEAGWVLEDNLMMNRAVELMQGDRYKTYRIYELQFD